MSDAQFTPEPWTVARAKYQQDGEYDFAIAAGGKVIAEAFGRVDEGEDGKRPAEANARLIASAPDLLAALVRLSNEVYGSFPLFEPLARREMGTTNYNCLMQRAEEARAIIARAEGRAP